MGIYRVSVPDTMRFTIDIILYESLLYTDTSLLQVHDIQIIQANTRMFLYLVSVESCLASEELLEPESGARISM